MISPTTFTLICKPFIALFCLITLVFTACKKDRPYQQQQQQITGLWQLAEAPKITLNLKPDGSFSYENTKVEDNEPKVTGHYRLQGKSIWFEVSGGGSFMDQASYKIKNQELFIRYTPFNNVKPASQQLIFRKLTP